MATIADLLIKIGGDSSGLRKEINATKRQISNAFGRDAIKQSQQTVTAMKYLATGFMAAGMASVKMAADMEQTVTAFTTLLGSANAAKDMVKNLTDFAARTPFEMTGITKSTQMLLAYGFKAQEVIPVLRAVGDAVSAMGGNTENMNYVIRALGQIQAKGKLSAEEMKQLSEQGINAWRYLAESMNVSVGQAQDMVRRKAVDSSEAITTILAGMNRQFAGGMDMQSRTINGMLSNIKDNTAAAGRIIGTNISEAFNFKGILIDVNDFLTEFATLAKDSGIGSAMKELVPDSVKLAVLGLSSVITVRMIPAMVSAIPKIMAFKAALFGWPGVISAAVFSLGFLASELSGTTRIMEGVSNNLATSFEGAEIGGNPRQRGQASGNIRARGKAKSAKGAVVAVSDRTLANGITEAELKALKTRNSLEAAYAKVKEQQNALEKASSMGNSAGGGAGKASRAATEAAETLKRLQEDAKAASDNIEDQWLDMTGTRLQVLDKWYSEESAMLDKTKAANQNYSRDMLRLDETYSEKKRQILQDEATERQRTLEEIKNGYSAIQRELASGTLNGSALDLFNLSKSAEDDFRKTSDYFAKITAEYADGTEAQKKNIIDALGEAGVEYTRTEEGRLDFSAELNEAHYSRLRQLEDERLEYYRQAKDIQSEIDQAYNERNFAMLQESLSAENAERLSNSETLLSLMETYEEIQRASHATTAELMASVYGTAFDSLSSNISELFMGTKSLTDAMKDFGKAILQVVADYFAKKIAGMLLESTVGKAAMAAQTAVSSATAATMAAAWAPAAAAVSLATMGANSAPAMAGISATHALSTALSIPGLAEGGFVRGPGTSLSDSIPAMLSNGEYVLNADATRRLGPGVLATLNAGRLPHAVRKLAEGGYAIPNIPLITNGYQDMGGIEHGGINPELVKEPKAAGGLSSKQSIEQHISVNVQAMDASSFEGWLEDHGGRVLERYLVDRKREFAHIGGLL